MFVYNRCTTDARVLREAATLQAAGHEVQIVAVLDTTTSPRELLPNGVQILRIDRRPLHYRLAWWVRGRRRGFKLGARRIARSVALRAIRPTGDRPPPEDAVVQQLLQERPVLRVMVLPIGPLLALLALSSAAIRRVLYAAHKPLMYTDYWGRGYRAAATAEFDVVHAHDLNTLPVAALIARHSPAQLVYDAHELYPEVSTLSALERWTWRRIEPGLVRQADRVITVCDSIAQEISARYRVPVPHVLLNCPSRYEDVDPAASPLRAAAGLESDARRLILYQGGFAPNRGLRELALAMHQLDGAVLVMMGWGRLEDELVALIRAERLERRVVMLPAVPREQLHRWTSGADIGAIPYQPVGLNNTFSTPNKLFEYMAAGIPIAATRLPEIAKIVDGHAIGVTFERVEPDQIAAAIRRMLDDPAELAAMRTRALAIRGRYTWEHEEAKLLAVYDGLANGRAASGR